MSHAFDRIQILGSPALAFSRIARMAKNNNITSLDFVPPEYLMTSNSVITSVDVKQYSNTRFSCFGLFKNSQDVKNYTTNLLVYPPENSWTGKTINHPMENRCMNFEHTEVDEVFS